MNNLLLKMVAYRFKGIRIWNCHLSCVIVYWDSKENKPIWIINSINGFNKCSKKEARQYIIDYMNEALILSKAQLLYD